MLVVEEVDDGRPAVAVVDVVTKAGRVNDSQLDLELLLLELSLDDVNLDCLVKLLGVTTSVVLASSKLS